MWPARLVTSNGWARDKQLRLAGRPPRRSVAGEMCATQKLFALARPREAVTWKDMLPVMQREAAHVWSLYERGIAREAWIRTDALGAVYVLETTPGAAGRLLASHPLATHGLVSFEVVPVGPFTPLAVLFGTQPHPVPVAAPTVSDDCRTQRVLAFARPVASGGEVAMRPHLAAEARHAWSLWKAGVIRETYLRTDRPGAAIVLEVSGIADAHRVLAGLPLVRHGLIAFDCLAVGAFIGYDALLDGALD